MSTLSSDFVGTPSQADAQSIPRRYVRTTNATDTYWREEIQSVSTGAAGGDSTVFPGAGTTFNVGGNTTVSPAAGSTFNVGGNTTAVISTASQVQVEPIAGAVFPVSGNTTSLITTASKIRVETTGNVTIQGDSTVFQGTSPWAVSGNTTIAGNTTVFPGANTTFQTRPIATPNGEFTFETGTTAYSTFALAVTSNAGTTALVTSGAGRVRVLSYDIQHSDTGTTVMNLIRFLSSNTTIAAPEWLLGQREGVAKQAPTGAYLFQTATGEALNLDLSTNAKTMAQVVFLRTS